MAFDRMAFNPPTGLCDTAQYPASPESEAQARQQVQSVSDQLKDYINLTFLPQLESAVAGDCGAKKIGSEEIQGVDGTDVLSQIESLKAQLDDVSAGSVSDGSITESKLAENAVTQTKIADSAVCSAQIAENAVTEAKIQNGAVCKDKIANQAVTGNKIAPAAVSSDHLGEGAVTNTKILAGAVSATKIADGAVTKTKLAQNALAWTLVLDEALNTGSGSISMANQAGKSEMLIQLRSSDGIVAYGAAAAPLNSEGRTMPYMHVISTYSPADFSFDYRMVTVGAAQISYTSSRAETLGGSTNLKRICVFTR